MLIQQSNLRWLSTLSIIYFVTFCPLHGHIEHDKEAPEVATTEGLPSNIVNQSVCVISGEYCDSVVDVVLPGPEPLVIQRQYSSFADGNLGKSWSFNHHDKLIVGEAIYKDDLVWIIGFRQPSGAQLDYVYTKTEEALKKKHLQFRLNIPKGLTNGASSLSGRNNIKNQELHFYPDEDKVVSISGAGDRKTFSKIGRSREGWNVCGQQTEEKVNGSIYKYEVRNQTWMGISRIICQSARDDQIYSFVKFQKKRKDDDHSFLTLQTSDGRHLNYFFQRHTCKMNDPEHSKGNRTFPQHYLEKVEHPYAPSETYEYEKRQQNDELQICLKRRPDGRYAKIDYYHRGMNKVGGTVGWLDISRDDDWRLDRVKRLMAPVGTDQNPITTHRFIYHCKLKKHKETGRKELLEGRTEVYDALDHLTTYDFDQSHRLTAITRHTGNSEYRPHSREEYLWSHEGDLLGKIFRDGQQKVHHARYFTYDERGNVTTSALCGNLTGWPGAELSLLPTGLPVENGYETERKTYTYSQDGLNLLLTEMDSNGKTIVYDYVKKTNHIRAKWTIYDGKIQLREFFRYDDHFTLIRKITDDGSERSSKDLTGVTERHITRITPRKSAPFGLAEKIEENYWDPNLAREVHLRTTECDYSQEGRLIKQTVFDANHQLAYTLHWQYDAHGNVISETNALGEVSTKEYDANDNLILQRDTSVDYSIKNTYDFANRLILQEEIHDDGQHYSTSHLYDYLGNCIKTINPYGQVTYNEFDEFGRIITTKYPSVLDENGVLLCPVTTKTYDLSGYPITTTDAMGNTTATQYNLRGQPTEILHPDGSKEQSVYRLDGQISQHVTKAQTRILYQRDPLGRIIEETVISRAGESLKKTQHFYKGLRLLKTIDSSGTDISYFYNPAGQLEWVHQNGKRQKNVNDAMGRLSEMYEWWGEENEYRVTKKIYDVLDRVTEETIESCDGAVLRYSHYSYDARGNRTAVQIGDKITYTDYNSLNQPTKITNAVGESTYVTYNCNYVNSHGQRVLQTKTTDPLGYQTLHTYDAAQRLVEISRLNPFGHLVAFQSFFYDLCGNRRLVRESAIQDNILQKTIETHYTYSKANEVTAIIEGFRTPEQKITRTSYNAYGQKSSMIQPNGIALFYEYDDFGRLNRLRSSDEAIHYQYEYNLRDQVTKVSDLCSGRSTERAYDLMGNMIQERLENGLSLKYEYDRLGRVCKIIFPDLTVAQYVYNASDLKEIHRVNANGIGYTHKDEAHSLSGQVLKVLLPGNNGELDYSYDLLGNYTSIKTKQYDQQISDEGFDKNGRIISYQAQGTSTRLSYDDCSHLSSEKGHVSHEYLLDSLSNRIVEDGQLHTYNSLHQLLSKGDEKFVYDANGNLNQRTVNGETICYTYDALNRLISVHTRNRKSVYTYDAFNRRMTKKKEGESEELYLYQGLDEIGMWSGGKCEQLRLLGKNKRSPMLALEIEGQPYVPVHDFFGNVVCLLDLQGQVMERYRFTAFGEKEIWDQKGDLVSSSIIGNPWQYASKRVDEESGLIAFGFRYYIPELGRWLSCDPAGFSDGPNLYAYVHHSPLLHYDQFGLYSNIALFGLAGSQLFTAAYSGISAQYSLMETCIGRFFGESQIEVKHKTIEDEFTSRNQFRNQDAVFERTAVYRLDRNERFTDSRTGKAFSLKESPEIGMAFVNGINTDFNTFKNDMIHLGQMTEYNMIGIHCPTMGLYKDIKCYFRSMINYDAYEGVRELHKVWYDFFKNCSAQATFLTLCHSRGVVYVRNALLSFPEELRKRIEVIAIAPGGYIHSDICKRVRHYESNADIIPLLDITGREKCKGTIITLEGRLTWCPWGDHSFLSPTFSKDLELGITNYVNRSECR